MNSRFVSTRATSKGDLYVLYYNTTDGPSSDKLMEVDVPLMSNSQCGGPAYLNTPIPDTQLCAGLDSGGNDSCQVSLMHIAHDAILLG